MSNIIDLNDEREKRITNNEFFSNLAEQSSMDPITVELIKNIIGLLQDYDIDPQLPETAENMIFLSILFQSHIDKINGKENHWSMFFDQMREWVNESE